MITGIPESIYLVTTALRHPTYGVNAMLSQIPRLPGQPLTAPVTLITSELESGEVARYNVPAQRPCVFVQIGSALDMPGDVTPGTWKADVTLNITVALADSKTEQGTRDLYAYLAAIKASLNALSSNDQTAARTINGVTLTVCESMTAENSTRPDGDALVMGTLQVKWNLVNQTGL